MHVQVGLSRCTRGFGETSVDIRAFMISNLRCINAFCVLYEHFFLSSTQVWAAASTSSMATLHLALGAVLALVLLR